MTGNGDATTIEHTEKRIGLTGGRAVVLRADNVQGRTAVRTTDRDDILVTATKWGRKGTAYDQAWLEIEADDRQDRLVVTVRPHFPVSSPFDGDGFDVDLGRDIARDIVKGLFGRRGGDDGDATVTKPQRRGRAGFDIAVELPRTLPDGSEVQIKTASGDIECEGPRGRIEIASASGDVRLRTVAGDLTVQTASGDVVLDGFTGTLTTRSASGDLRIEHAQVTRWLASLASGDVEFSGELAAGADHRVQSVSGDIRMRIDEAVGTEIEFKTVSGSGISSGTVRRDGKRHFFTGPEGGPHARLVVKSVSGDLEVSSHSPVDTPAGTGWATPASPAVAPSPPTPPSPPSPPTPPSPPPPPDPAATRAGVDSHPSPAPEPPAPVQSPAGSDHWVVARPEAADRGPDDGNTRPEPTDAPAVTDGVIPLGDPDLAHPGELRTGEVDLSGSHGPEGDAEAERMAILASLERGEIDVDDAMRRLDDIQGAES